ncbi:MAG: peptidylprolyl isomerase [Candidatus Bostrichicola ureolyticus]|nr:MAG: peptidylprolyl isomerase [Candidatus Bostrichicola ureolyticus]
MQKKIFIYLFIIITYLINSSYTYDKIERKDVDSKKDKVDSKNEKIEVDSIVAQIGNKIILKSEIDKLINENFCSNKKEHCYKFYDLLKDKLLIDLINNLISKNEINEINKEAILKFKKLNFDPNISKQIFYYIKNNIYYNRIIKIINHNNDIYVSPKEIHNYINYINNKNKIFIPSIFELSTIIFFPKITNDHKKQIINKLYKIKKEIENGGDFNKKAIIYSDDIKSSINGGLIKGLNFDLINNDLKKVISSLKEGELSKPFEIESKFILLKLEKIRVKEFDIRLILIKPKYTKEEFYKTLKWVYSVNNDIINNKISFEDARYKYPNILMKDKIQVNKNKIPSILKNKKNGYISKPLSLELNGIKVFYLIKLINKIPLHQLSFESDYEYIKNFLYTKKSLKNIMNFIKSNIKDTFIKIFDEKYKNCYKNCYK